MNITVRHGEVQKARDGAIVVNLFEDVDTLSGATAAVDKASGGQIRRVRDSGDFTGALAQTIVLYPEDRRRVTAQRIIIVGLGRRGNFDLESARRASAAVARRLQLLGIDQATSIIHGAGAGDLDTDAAAQALVEAAILATYRFDHYMSKAPKGSTPLKKLTIVEADSEQLTAVRRGAKAGQQIATGVCLARDLCNHPGNTATPTYLAQQARRISRNNSLTCKILDEPAMKKLGMGALLGVAAGSAQPPRFIILEHNRPPGKKASTSKPLVFVGKGVTFDSGGISIKGSAKMGDMKFDMSGAAAVIGAMQAVSALGLKQHIVGLVPATENLLDGKAYKPGDILRTMSGKTIEIDNTDAEGRLILADALTYAQRFKPAAIVDLATLTGACVVALGSHATGLVATDDDLAQRLQTAGDTTGERVWRLPLWDEYKQQIRSPVADMKNSGGRDGGAITAAALLAEFAGDAPWAHLDIAGTAWSQRSQHYTPRGGVGIGVRLLVELARNWSARPGRS